MQEETDMLKIVEAGRGKFEEIGKGKSWSPAGNGVSFNEEQAAAVEHVLRSRDLVTAVCGVAGSGKTTMLDQTVRAIADLSGLDVMAFAPSASATQVLRKQGFKSAVTVQKLLPDPEIQRLASGKILLVDEAGFLSVREMRQLVSFAASNNCRVILSGDSRQHHSVERGDALRILEKSAAVASAALTKIFRQQIPALRAAIEDLSQGKTEEGFDKLDELGVIREIEETGERIKAICDLYIGAVRQKQSSLVVAPTHGEGRRIADAMRRELRAQGLIGEAEHIFTRLQKLNLTKAQREDAINYLPGHVVEFHRRAAGGFKSGEQWQVIGSQGRKEIVVERNGGRRFLPLAQAGKFTLFRTESVALSVGDTVRITKNFRAGGTRFRNNELHTVTAIETGKVTLDAGELGSRGALHLDQGIVVTSHASQGKTVEQVIVSVPVQSFSQANEAQFYVSMSRARKAMHLLTDSKVALREAVTRKSVRLSPWELIAGGNSDRLQRELIAKLGFARNCNKKVNGHTKGQIKRDDRDHIGLLAGLLKRDGNEHPHSQRLLGRLSERGRAIMLARLLWPRQNVPL
jgi:ATP-dependent exoDNAse (exonuclease V) alpha subunit